MFELQANVISNYNKLKDDEVLLEKIQSCKIQK